MKLLLLFPHQLYTKSLLPKCDKVVLVEDPLYFGTHKKYPFKFHKKKLLLHRASMKRYLDEVLENADYLEFYENLEEYIKKQKVSKIVVFDPTDFLLEKMIYEISKKLDIELEVLESPNFLCKRNEFGEFFLTQKYHQTDFYRKMRIKHNILMDSNGKPVGGSLTYDTQNRKKLPKDISIPQIKKFGDNKYIKEAKEYIKKYFKENYGNTEDFFYPTNEQEAKEAFLDFLENRFQKFGPYEDAISKNENFIFHSLLSSSLNTGLLNPDFVISKTLEYAKQNEIDITSLEGFVRQIIGWREFMRAIYILEGVKIRNSNFWKFQKQIPRSFWEGNTGIEPLDITIKKLLKTSYNHHIERLMVLGNFMFLSEFDPDDVYKWFMEMYIDAYDWVMVPNVYSMSQYADGGLITTKPYMSGSNYILKMSDFQKGEWCKTWDEMYWGFIKKHKDILSKNPRMSLIVKLSEKIMNAWNNLK